jgi:8-oxo-dGTP pyrophosphatase MutT (NUDIX family)
MTRRRLQYAALPFRLEEGSPQVLLITSRETRRWILPKGNSHPGQPPFESAAREAYEEAGVTGWISTGPSGRFASFKRLRNGTVAPCLIKVFLLEVREELPDWPERSQRDRRWATPGEAALLVGEAALTELLLNFGALWT